MPLNPTRFRTTDTARHSHSPCLEHRQTAGASHWDGTFLNTPAPQGKTSREIREHFSHKPPNIQSASETPNYCMGVQTTNPLSGHINLQRRRRRRRRRRRKKRKRRRRRRRRKRKGRRRRRRNIFICDCLSLDSYLI